MSFSLSFGIAFVFLIIPDCRDVGINSQLLASDGTGAYGIKALLCTFVIVVPKVLGPMNFYRLYLKPLWVFMLLIVFYKRAFMILSYLGISLAFCHDELVLKGIRSCRRGGWRKAALCSGARSF